MLARHKVAFELVACRVTRFWLQVYALSLICVEAQPPNIITKVMLTTRHPRVVNERNEYAIARDELIHDLSSVTSTSYFVNPPTK
jgi:hypothetical protein